MFVTDTPVVPMQYDIFFIKAQLLAEFRYEIHAGLEFWATSLRFERCALSVMGRLVPAHFRCSYNLRESARNHLLYRIPWFYQGFEMFQ